MLYFRFVGAPNSSPSFENNPIAERKNTKWDIPVSWLRILLFLDEEAQMLLKSMATVTYSTGIGNRDIEGLKIRYFLFSIKRKGNQVVQTELSH
jgi:hypothetical protein